MIFEPRAADLDLVDVENALLRAALGDYSDEAAILLLITSGHWLPQLQHAGLITVDGKVDGEGLWAHIYWPDLDGALRIGTIIGRSSDHQVLRAAASIADGHPVDLGELAAGLDRHGLTLVLAAISHAAGSHEPRSITHALTESRTRVTDCRPWFPGPSRTTREPPRDGEERAGEYASSTEGRSTSLEQFVPSCGDASAGPTRPLRAALHRQTQDLAEPRRRPGHIRPGPGRYRHGPAPLRRGGG
ncbi:hypothetical protein [Blastococcus brunescens]|uniref:Uncharacterized protein n=1 Tax=Blastococcus brunescens TaxID=1564165 RepID=A0ABZ1B2H8_9ACTN|nr:hypothetical protein [Blastococcus sp. BMG 8361]WRL64993.1 hypothetical protein U6N30_04570 [Blastococcus sp. BMG 8361]